MHSSARKTPALEDSLSKMLKSIDFELGTPLPRPLSPKTKRQSPPRGAREPTFSFDMGAPGYQRSPVSTLHLVALEVDAAPRAAPDPPQSFGAGFQSNAVEREVEALLASGRKVLSASRVPAAAAPSPRRSSPVRPGSALPPLPPSQGAPSAHQTPAPSHTTRKVLFPEGSQPSVTLPDSMAAATAARTAAGSPGSLRGPRSPRVEEVASGSFVSSPGNHAHTTSTFRASGDRPLPPRASTSGEALGDAAAAAAARIQDSRPRSDCMHAGASSVEDSVAVYSPGYLDAVKQLRSQLAQQHGVDSPGRSVPAPLATTS